MTDKHSSYKLTPLAESDLENIWFYTVENWSVRQADVYIHDIVDTFEALASGLKTGRSTDIRDGYYKYQCGSHIIFYRHNDTALEIVRILHKRMDVERHL